MVQINMDYSFARLETIFTLQCQSIQGAIIFLGVIVYFGRFLHAVFRLEARTGKNYLCLVGNFSGKL